jgi:uncharacterized delta-60 repeat protein
MRKFFWLGMLLILMVPGMAQAKAGALDPSFGKHGKLVIPQSQPELDESGVKYPALAMDMTLAPGGKMVLANSHLIEERRADGSRNLNFGRRGVVPIPVAAGSRFALAGIAVDALGRVLVAGTTEPPAGAGEGPPNFSSPPPAMGTVYRFLSNGKPDANFGSGGSVTSTFSQAPPSGPGPAGRYPYTSVPGEYPYATPSVRVTGLAVDSLYRPVVLGSSVARVTQCVPAGTVTYLNRTFVARLDPTGKPDLEFGSADGVATNPYVEDPSGPALQPSGKILFTNPGEEACERIPSAEPPTVTFLGNDGQTGRQVPTSANLGSLSQLVRGLAVDRRGRILVLLQKQVWEAGGEPDGILVRRLTPSGAADPSFGKGGSISPKLPPRADLTTLTTDGRGRVVLAGSTSGGSGRGFLVMRLNRAGKVDRSFARKGRVTASFPGNARASQVSIDKRDRIVVGGTMTTTRLNTEYGFVFARYRGH